MYVESMYDNIHFRVGYKPLHSIYGIYTCFCYGTDKYFLTSYLLFMVLENGIILRFSISPFFTHFILDAFTLLHFFFIFIYRFIVLVGDTFFFGGHDKLKLIATMRRFHLLEYASYALILSFSSCWSSTPLVFSHLYFALALFRYCMEKYTINQTLLIVK